jgi:hypothetical protein
MEQLDKTRLIISLRNIIRVLGITEEELFNKSTIQSSTLIPTPTKKEPELKPEDDSSTYVVLGTNEKGEDQKLKIDDIDKDPSAQTSTSNMADFLARHPDSLIKDEEKKYNTTPSIPLNNANNTLAEMDEDVDPSQVDDDFGGLNSKKG